MDTQFIGSALLSYGLVGVALLAFVEKFLPMVPSSAFLIHLSSGAYPATRKYVEPSWKRLRRTSTLRSSGVAAAACSTH
jgi:hypothetical protein